MRASDTHVTEWIAPCTPVVLNDPRERLAAVARSQYGVFARHQARAAGFSLPQVKRRVRDGEWEAVDHAIYRVRGTPPAWEQRLLAACLAGPAVASHRSSARLWRLAGFEDALVEVTAVRHLRRHAPDVIWHESRVLNERDVTTIDRIPTTRVGRTLVDLGSVVDRPVLQLALDDALRRRLATAVSVLAIVERLGPQRRGGDVVRRAIARRIDGDGPPESVLETRFDELVRAAGLPRPERQHTVRDRTGVLVARIDFAYSDHLLAIEIDSIRHHAGVDDWRLDLTRQNQLLALGWRVLRFTADDLDRRPAWIIRMVRAALAPGMRI